jgi:hypothetical protein
MTSMTATATTDAFTTSAAAETATHTDEVKLSPDELEALCRLSAVQGRAELSAAILALVMAAGSEASRAAWARETEGLLQAEALQEAACALGDAVRLPCLELLLTRMRLLPRPDRRTLLESTRRLMAAHRPLRPLDRLHWLVMRRRFGDLPPASTPQKEDPAQLPTESVLHIARVTAYLSRLVPGLGDAAARTWYAQALGQLVPPAMIPPHQPLDGEGLVHALQEVETLPWMTRPVLVRTWVSAAIAICPGERLPGEAADALRLVAGLLDSPLPPKLAGHYIELP